MRFSRNFCQSIPRFIPFSVICSLSRLHCVHFQVVERLGRFQFLFGVIEKCAIDLVVNFQQLPMHSTTNMSVPRKFSEKIAIQKQKAAEQEEAFASIMREVATARHSVCSLFVFFFLSNRDMTASLYNAVSDDIIAMKCTWSKKKTPVSENTAVMGFRPLGSLKRPKF